MHTNTNVDMNKFSFYKFYTHAYSLTHKYNYIHFSILVVNGYFASKKTKNQKTKNNNNNKEQIKIRIVISIIL